MKYRRYLCLALAVLMVALCASCGMYGSSVLDPTPAPEKEEPPFHEDEAAPEEKEPIPVQEKEPVPEETPEPEDEEPAGEEEPEPTAEPKPTAEPVPAVRPGTYTGTDGSVLTVSDDGACAYETEVILTVNGQNVSETVTFLGEVDAEGIISFEKVTYRGMDITSMAAKAGYDNAGRWEDAANAIYKNS